ncbi:MAG: CHAT domain-containing tetratricopeptide repeat protein [Bacteroidota bacterium]
MPSFRFFNQARRLSLLVGVFLCALGFVACQSEDSEQSPSRDPIVEAQLDSIRIAEGKQLMEEGKGLVRDPQSAEDLQRAAVMLAAAVDSFLLAKELPLAYEATLNEIVSHVHLTRYERGILAFEKVAPYDEQVADTSLNKAKLYNNVAACYAEAFYPTQAIRVLDTVAAIQQRRVAAGLQGLSESMYAKSRTNLGVIYMTKGVYAKAASLRDFSDQLFRQSESLHLEAIRLLPQIPNPDERAVRAADFENNYGLTLMHWGKLAEAEERFRNARNLRLPAYQDGTDIDNLGHLRLWQERFGESISLQEEAKQTYQRKYGNISPDFAEIETRIGLAHAQQGRHPQALESYQQAMVELSWEPPGRQSFQQSDYFDNPPLFQVASPAMYLTILDAKTKSLDLFIDPEDPDALMQSLPTYYRAFEAMEDIRKQGLSEQVGFMLASKGRKIADRFLTTNSQLVLAAHGQAITKRFLRVGQQIRELSRIRPEVDASGRMIADMFQAIEQTRASILLRGIQLAQLDLIGQLREETQTAIFQNSANIRELREAIYSLSKQDSGATAIQSLTPQLGQELARQDSILQVIQREAPGYYSLRYDTLQSSFADIQAALDPDQVLLEYFWGEESLYTFKLSPDSVHLFIQPEDSLQAWIEQVLPTISEFPSDTTLDSFRSLALPAARKLYQVLLGSVLNEQEQAQSRLVVVRDSSLTQLPFQMLLASDPPDEPTPLFQDLDYALKHHSFSYQYSANLFVFQKNLPRYSSKGVLAMAPFPDRGQQEPYFDGKDTVVALPASQAEVEAIPGNRYLLIGPKANRETFLQQPEQYAVLHFSSHAEANSSFPDSSFVRFNFQGNGASKFWAGEVADLNLQAESVVLSACETAAGTFVGGEGLLSLARAFTLGGARHVLATQWPLLDRSGAIIIGAYYQELDNQGWLDEGLPKDLALQNAQLTYLEDAAGGVDRLGHPYFWAALISIGTNTPIGKCF